MVVDDCGEQVVRGGYRVEIAGEMEIYVLHRNDLSVSAACRAAFDAEDRSERRLSERDYRLLAKLRERHAETDGRRGFALARGGRVYRGDEDELAVRLFAAFSDKLLGDFRLVFAVQLKLIFRYIKLTCNLPYRFHLGFLRDFNISKHFYSPRVLNL